MSRRKKLIDTGNDVEDVIPEPVQEFIKPTERLKADHTHAGVLYPAGTVLDELNLNESKIKFLRENKII